MKIRKIGFVLLCVVMTQMGGCQKKYNGRYYEKADWDLSSTNKLMFVAHPDDDTIWGGAHLLHDKYLVVCITCGVKEHRVKEFKAAMEFSDDQYYMLSHTDTLPENKEITSDWKDDIDAIYEEVKEIIQLKDWDEVVTHNPQGEYGHPHHIKTNEIVTEVYQEVMGNLDHLMYFGKYIKPADMTNEIRNNLPQIDEETRIKKREMIDFYPSQKFIVDAFGHMFRYENWVPANEWQD